MSNGIIAQVMVSASIVALLLALLILLAAVSGRSPALRQMFRYHAPWIFNAALLFGVQILHLLDMVEVSTGLLGFWGVVSFAIVPLSFFIHIMALIRG